MAATDLTLGAVEIGVLIASIFYGISASQTYAYLNNRHDIFTRFLVIVVYVLETAHTICVWIYLYALTITNFGIPIKIVGIWWSLVASIILSALTSFCVQTFLGYRIWMLSGHIVFGAAVWIVASVHTVMGMTMAGLATGMDSIPQFMARYNWLVTTELAIHVGVDVYNTAVLSFLFLRTPTNSKTSKTSFSNSPLLITLCFIPLAKNGLVTSVLSLVILICSITMKNNFVFLAVFTIYPKVFANVLLVSLTSRDDLHQGPSKKHSAQYWGGFSGRIEGNFATSSAQLPSKKPSEKSRHLSGIKVTTETEMRDEIA